MKFILKIILPLIFSVVSVAGIYYNPNKLVMEKALTTSEKQHIVYSYHGWEAFRVAQELVAIIESLKSKAIVGFASIWRKVKFSKIYFNADQINDDFENIPPEKHCVEVGYEKVSLKKRLFRSECELELDNFRLETYVISKKKFDAITEALRWARKESGTIRFNFLYPKDSTERRGLTIEKVNKLN